jgi:hypothetical protein
MKKIMQQTLDLAPPRVGTWTLAAGAVLVLSVGLVLRGGASPASTSALTPLEAKLVQKEMSTDVQLSATRESQVVAQDVQALDPEETLSSFWGERWTEVESELFPDGFDAAGLQPILPWEQVREAHYALMAPDGECRVEALYRRLVSWPVWEFYGAHPYRADPRFAELTPLSLFQATRCAGVRELDQAEIEQLELRFSALNSELDGLARAFIDGVGAAVRHEFEHGGYERAPVGFPDVLARSDTDVYSRKISAGGWVTRISLDATTNPSLALLKDEIDALRKRRANELREAVAELSSSRQASRPAS